MARKIIGEIWHEGKRFFSLNFSASLCGYSKEYLRQLILKEKLKAEMINGNWFVSEDELAKLQQRLGANNSVKNKNNEITELKEEIKRLRNLFESQESQSLFLKSKIQTTSVGKIDPWDRLLLGVSDDKAGSFDTQHSLPSNSRLLARKTQTPIVLSLFVIFLAGFFFYKYPESVSAGFKDFKNFSHQISNQISLLKTSLQTSAFLAAVSIQETAVDFKETAQETVLNLPNQVRSLSLS